MHSSQPNERELQDQSILIHWLLERKRVLLSLDFATWCWTVWCLVHSSKGFYLHQAICPSEMSKPCLVRPKLRWRKTILFHEWWRNFQQILSPLVFWECSVYLAVDMSTLVQFQHVIFQGPILCIESVKCALIADMWHHPRTLEKHTPLEGAATWLFWHMHTLYAI